MRWTSCHERQMWAVKYRQPTDQMVLPDHSMTPFEVVHLAFAEVQRKSEGVKRAQAFLLGIDECTRMATARAGEEDANSMISLLSGDVYRQVKVIVSQNGPVFRSHKLKE